MHVWLGRHPTRIAGRKKDAHEDEKSTRSMLFDRGHAERGFHIPPNVRDIDCQPAIAACFRIVVAGFSNASLYIYASIGNTDADL